jgi:Fe-S oxidoreductase
MEVLVGLDRRRLPPAFVRETFLDWWQSHGNSLNQASRNESHRMALFADTFTNFHEPAIPIAATNLAAAAGWQVVVPPRVCCGRPLISKGFLDEAREQAGKTVRILEQLVDQGLPIVFVEPGCYSAVRDDYPLLLRGEMQRSAKRVAEACLTFEQWASHALDGLSLKPGPQRVFAHTHCHQRALVGTAPILRALGRISGCEVVDLDAGCCGMAGSFGYEREHYEISQAVGERKLFPAVREKPPQSVVVAPGFSCRHQIAHFTNVKAVHPAVLLQELL